MCNWTDRIATASSCKANRCALQVGDAPQEVQGCQQMPCSSDIPQKYWSRDWMLFIWFYLWCSSNHCIHWIATVEECCMNKWHRYICKEPLPLVEQTFAAGFSEPSESSSKDKLAAYKSRLMEEVQWASIMFNVLINICFLMLWGSKQCRLNETPDSEAGSETIGQHLSVSNHCFWPSRFETRGFQGQLLASCLRWQEDGRHTWPGPDRLEA